MNEAILTVDGLTKNYGRTLAVDRLSLSLKKGEVLGLLGPNGAGKTTTLECIEGLRTPASGQIEVAGLHPLRDGRALRQVLGVQLQSSALPETMLVREALSMVCAWHGSAPRQDLLERFGLQDLGMKQYRHLSTGQKRRLQLALALAGDPQIIILDEPTAGLDVEGRAELHDKIRELKASGVSLLLATHDMAEAESLCDRIAILIGGQLAVLGTPAQVTAAGSQETRIVVRTRKQSLTAQGSVRESRFVGETEGLAEWRCHETGPAVMELIQTVMNAGDAIEDLRVQRPSLEERFIEILQGGRAS